MAFQQVISNSVQYNLVNVKCPDAELPTRRGSTPIGRCSVSRNISSSVYGAGAQLCLDCEVVKPLTPEYFGKNRARESGFMQVCRPCHRERARRFREANLDSVRQRNREYMRRYREVKPDAMLAYRRENAETIARKAREWKDRHPEQVRAIKARRRAAERGADGDISAEEIRDMLQSQDGLCAYCETPLEDYHIDHMMPLSRGGTGDWSNIALSCQLCNNRKYTRTAEEFIEWLFRK